MNEKVKKTLILILGYMAFVIAATILMLFSFFIPYYAFKYFGLEILPYIVGSIAAFFAIMVLVYIIDEIIMKDEE